MTVAMTRVGAFLRAPARRRRLAIEAGWELLRARLLTMRKASVYSPELGRLVEGEGEPAAAPDGATEIAAEVAAEIGAMIARAARVLPFRARCLQQAIAVRRMLTRRGIPATVYLGVARDRADRASADNAAHAWVEVGARIVSGDGALEKFAVVARFA